MERGFLLRTAITSVSVFPFGMAPKIASHALLVMRSAMNFHNMQRKRERIREKNWATNIQKCQSSSFYLSISLLLFLCVFSCLFLLPSAPWSTCQHCRCLCSLSKSFHSDSQWNFVSVSQLKRSKSQSSVRHSSSLCLLIIARLRGSPAAAAVFSGVIHCEMFDVYWGVQIHVT